MWRVRQAFWPRSMPWRRGPDRGSGYRFGPSGVRELADVPVVLGGADESVVFNLVEGFQHHPEDFNYVPALVRSFGKACTGNDTPGMVLSLDKWQSKALLRAAGLPCPKAVRVEPGQRLQRTDLFPGPYIVKPTCTDASEGIDNASLIATAARNSCRRSGESMTNSASRRSSSSSSKAANSISPSSGRKGSPVVLPLAEIEFRGFGDHRPRIVGYEAKWVQDSFEYSHTVRVIPAPLPKRLATRFDSWPWPPVGPGCLDYCRVDFRLDRRLNPDHPRGQCQSRHRPGRRFCRGLAGGGHPIRAIH